MLAPLNRAFGSTLFLRYRGVVELGDDANVYPQDPVVYPGDSSVVSGLVRAWVRFPLWNALSTRSTLTELPAFVFDDIGLHSTVASLASATPGINTSDLSLNTKTWAQNINVVSRTIDPNVLAADTGVSIDNNPSNGAMILRDSGASSGLGYDTGLPVVAVLFTVSSNDGVRRDFSIDVTIEIRHTGRR